MKRYKQTSFVREVDDKKEVVIGMEPDKEGEWVLWDDVLPLLEDVLATLAETRLSASVIQGEVSELYDTIEKGTKQ